jgi:hypothetical protein
MSLAHFAKFFIIFVLLIPSLRAEADGTLDQFFSQPGRSLSFRIDGNGHCIARVLDSLTLSEIESNELGLEVNCTQSLMGLVRLSRVMSKVYSNPSVFLELFKGTENSDVVALTGLSDSKITLIENYLRKQSRGTQLTVSAMGSPGVMVRQLLVSPGRVTEVRTLVGRGFQSLHRFCQSDRDLMEEFLDELRDLNGVYWKDKQIIHSVIQVQFLRNTASGLGQLPPEGSLLEKALRSVMIEAGVRFNSTQNSESQQAPEEF